MVAMCIADFFTLSRRAVQNSCTCRLYKCRKVLPTCKIASPRMHLQAFPDVSVVPMQPTSHWTRWLRPFDKHILDTYNLTIDHCHQILNSKTGHPGRWNSNNAVVRFDSFMTALRDGALDELMEFTLKRKKEVKTALYLEGCCDCEKVDNIEDVTIKGAYDIIDNGYLRWPTTISPLKDPCIWSELHF